MERIEKFEKMLADITAQAEFENAEIDRLKRAGKDKTATYKQYLGNKLMLKFIKDEYKRCGLIERQPGKICRIPTDEYQKTKKRSNRPLLIL